MGNPSKISTRWKLSGLSLSVLVVILAFQNCGDFQATDQLMVSSTGDIIVDPPDQPDDPSTGVPTPTPDQTATPTPTPAPTPTPTPTPAPPANGDRNLSTDRALFFGNSRCANSGLQLCEDFENGTISNIWSIEGTRPQVDSVQAARGLKALHITRAGSGQSLIRQKSTFPAPNNTYFGRMFVYFKVLPKNPDMTFSHWTIVGANGQSATPGEIRVGGELENGRNSFGVGTDSRTGTGDWTFNDTDGKPPQAVPLNKWVCIEWMHKGDTNETRFWWDGVEHPSMYTTATRHGGTKGKQYILPKFDSVWVGWYSYQRSSQTFELWIDEVAFDPKRIGCVQ